MRISDVEAIHLRVEGPDGELFDSSYEACVIVVRTDGGVEGIGETESLPTGIQALINGPSSHRGARGLREVLMNEDPSDPERLWELMYEAAEFVGRRGLVMHALGGIDIALWDIRGKVEGKPVYELLGGARHRRIPAYGSIYPMERTEDGVRRQIEAGQAKNLRAFKIAADPWWMEDLSHTSKLLKAARTAAGPETRLIIDAALAYRSADEGLRLLPILKEIGAWFFEAPLPLDDVAGHARISGHGVPIGVGDLGFTHVNEFIEMMEHGGADICQPDITMVGGFTGIQKITQAARKRGRSIIPHCYKTNIETAANLHFLASLSEESILEYSLSGSPLRWSTTNESFPVEKDGTVLVPDRPGLGVTLNWGTVTNFTFLPGVEKGTGLGRA